MSRTSAAPVAELLRWRKRFLTWAIDPRADFGDVAPAEAAAAIEWALRCWEEACYLFFSPGEFHSADVRVVTAVIPGGAIAISEFPDGTDVPRTVRFDPSAPWFFEKRARASQIDLGLCALHEFGHVIGIPHLPGHCVMSERPHQAGVDELTDADVAAALARYPRSSRP